MTWPCPGELAGTGAERGVSLRLATGTGRDTFPGCYSRLGTIKVELARLGCMLQEGVCTGECHLDWM